jgi:transcriptional regulator with XRE-family HTH domain
MARGDHERGRLGPAKATLQTLDMPCYSWQRSMGNRALDLDGWFKRGKAINPSALRQARHDAGMTLAQASAGICTRQALSQYENGRARPSEPKLTALAERLNVPVDAVLASPHDPREQRMRELEAEQHWLELEQLAAKVLADRNVTARTQAVAHFYRGRACLNQAPQESLGHLRHACGQLARLGEPWLSAEARDWEGAALYLLQDPSALDVGRDALARYRRIANRDPGVEARMLEHIGTYQLWRQEVSDAMASYRQAIDIAGAVLNLGRLVTIYHGLASGCLRLGRDAEAREYFERAVYLCRTENDVRGTVTANLARLESDFGDFLVRVGHWRYAEEMIGAALGHFAALGVEAGRTAPLLTMGDLKHQQGEVDEAMRWTLEGIQLAERLGETVNLALGYQQLGELHASRSELDHVEASFSRALQILTAADLPERRAEAMQRYRNIRRSQAKRQRGS